MGTNNFQERFWTQQKDIHNTLTTYAYCGVLEYKLHN